MPACRWPVSCRSADGPNLTCLGLRGNFTRSNLADANEPLGLELDSTTIDLCLRLFPWAPFRSTKAAIKLHTLLDLRGAIPGFFRISDGKWHDVNVLDLLIPEAGAFYVMDCG
jgi:hypothetical protein